MSTEPQTHNPQFSDYPTNLFREDSRDHANQWDGNALRVQANPASREKTPTPTYARWTNEG